MVLLHPIQGIIICCLVISCVLAGRENIVFSFHFVVFTVTHARYEKNCASRKIAENDDLLFAVVTCFLSEEISLKSLLNI